MSGLRPHRPSPSWKERGLLSRTAAGDQFWCARMICKVKWRVTDGTVVGLFVIHVVKLDKESLTYTGILFSATFRRWFGFVSQQFHFLGDVEEVDLIVCRVNDSGIIGHNTPTGKLTYESTGYSFG